MVRTLGVSLCVFACMLIAFPAHALVLHVDPGAPGGGNGLTWATAYQDINTAIAAASASDDIWIKGGTYSGQVLMADFVDLFGGFAGNETNISERVLGATPTILDAQSLTSGLATVDGESGTIDGFTITGNQSGVHVSGGTLTIRHCIIRDNPAFGVNASDEDAVIIDSCLIYGNGTGVKTSPNNTAATFLNTTITGNSVKDADIDGRTNPLTVQNSVIWPSEFAPVLDGTIPNITNSIIFTTNVAILNSIGSDVLITTPIFADSVSDDYRLRPDSPGVDQGADTGTVTTDITGAARTMGSATDMGAFEYDPAGDFDGDTLLDSFEGFGDPDFDTIPNLADLDSDNDNVLDVYEGSFNSDNDADPDFIDEDRDNNGIDDIDDAFIVYVDNTPAKGAAPDGRSWATAFTTIQEAIDLAGPAGEDVLGGHVWIAEGVYNENRTLIRNSVNTGSLLLRKKVTLFGGFDGDETSFDERVLEFNKTIIDGAIARDGNPAYQVVRGAAFTKLDGLTVRGGRANLDVVHDVGAGLECPSQTWTDINACLFYDNFAMYEGGAIRFAGAAATISNSIFVQNSAMNGGTIIMSQGTAPDEDGNTPTSQLNVLNCVFYNNSTITPPDDLEGSAILSRGPAILVRNSIFWNNTDIAVRNTGAGGIFYANSNMEPGVSYGFFQGGGGDLGGNIAIDPEFLDPATLDFRITIESPSYDTGTAINTPTGDILGDLRPRGAAHEMGAFEVGERQDLDGDTVPDYIEGAGDPDSDEIPNYLDDDSDNDTLLDGEEVNTYMTDPTKQDTDGDTLRDDAEVNTHMTNPNEKDSDGDNIDDDDEILVYMTNPNERDSDGDNLDDDVELFVHMTNPNKKDSDNDLMEDDFEVNNGLDPNLDDADENPDMDPFTNLEEFNRGSDPQDGNSPFRNLYASVLGSDTLGDGSELNPWRTIAFTMSQAAMDAASDNFVTIHLAEGLYEEPVIFVDNVGILGAGPNSVIRHFEENDPIHNVVVAADNTELRDVTVDIPIAVGDDTTLLRIDDVAITVDGVVFNGRSNLDSTGALVARSGSSASIITNSTFTSLENGVHAVNSGVRIARNTFQFINQGNAIFIGFAQNAKGGGEEPVPPGLGDGLDVAQTGFNRFRNIDGFFINIDELVPVTTFAEYNDWGTDDPAEIAAGISLPQVKGVSPEVDFEPFLKTRLAPSTVIVPLFVEGETDAKGKPIPVPLQANPSVTLSPGIGAGERDPGTGVFLFPNVPNGSYTIDGQATNYDANQSSVNANSGDSIVATLTLVSQGAQFDPEDLNNDGSTNSIDIQLTINTVLGSSTGVNGDVNNDGSTNSIDIQLVINAVLGL